MFCHNLLKTSKKSDIKFLSFARIAPLLTFAFAFASTISNVGAEAQQEEVSDGLSRPFMKRAAKAAAAAYLSRAGENLSVEEGVTTAEGIEIMKKEFSENAKITQYSEQGAEEGRDDAIFIEDDGQCFVAFQSTTTRMDDVLQNANLSKETLCRGVNECCEFRKGFVNGWK